MEPISIKTKFHNIEGWETGNPQGKTILAFHGWLDNANTFLPLAEHFPDYRFISLDFPGHGKSSHKPDGTIYHFVEYALEIIAVSQVLGLKDFILLGHSMGAAICTLVAGLEVLELSHLVLIEALGPMTSEPKKAPEIMKEAISQILHPRGKKETYFPDWDSAIAIRMRAGDMKKESVEILMDRGLEKGPKGLRPRRDLRLHYNSLIRLTEEHVISFCKNIQCPTLLLLGKQSMYPISQIFEERKNAIRNFKEVLLEGGHHLHLDDPEPIANEMKKFLSESSNVREQ
ncbi:hydrolase or acetyltransferase [Leptospira ryugenii]|uniref:Hydrolase or acetyltransferase n=1 Tax=Leptospira ryugenii TaxID=1917863 RepID=A0A2P2E4W8_9LEPT|nr:alpha/beta hydrolase [Leptospira ryugenii]GBF51914.1 hydrolase or acetyltransferase [Leptospira ryugenii]